jgi:nicotinate-nucleotide adenylyltransferase
LTGSAAPARPQRRVGLFGGAFDPPHRAHVALAQAAIDQLQLDELRVLPTGQAWHKPQTLSPAADRLAMARIAFGDLSRVALDERELNRQGPSYTIDSLRELQAEQPDAGFFLVIGEDQAQSFTTWRDWQSIARLATICLAERPSLAERPGGQVSALPAPARVQWLNLPAMPESATDIRRRAAAGESIGHLVPAGVASYIDQHHLYHPT